jgi:hypothetical protein
MILVLSIIKLNKPGYLNYRFRFVPDENVQVEFVKDNEKDFSKLIMWWSDGRMSEKVKVK